MVGSFGIVKEAVHIETGKRYALKIVRLSQIRKNLNGLSNFAAELNVYKKIIGLSIAHTCRILGVYRNSEKQKIYILLDFCDFSLSELIFSTTKRQDPDENSDIIEHGGFDETFCCLVIRQLLEGLRELHEKYFILHNDIKEHNIMMRGSDLQIIDFGVAQVRHMC